MVGLAEEAESRMSMRKTIHARPNILLTGGTGLIGGQLTLRLAPDATKIWALVRGNSGDTQVRLHRRIARSGALVPKNVLPIQGDISAPHCGIRECDLQEIYDECEIIVHSAGSTDFNDTSKCQAANVTGSCQLIKLARKCRRLKRVFVLSSAAVVSAPDSTELTETFDYAGHTNSYIASKREAEELFRNSGLDCIIVRPSAVMSKDIPDAAFASQMMWVVPAAMMIGGLPLSGRELVDLVPVGYVADAVTTLVCKERRLKYDCYHISSGQERATRTADIMAWAQIVWPNVPFSFVNAEQWHQMKSRRRRIMNAIERSYIPFVSANVTYSNARLNEALGAGGQCCPSFSQYAVPFLRLLRETDVMTESMHP